MSGKLSKKTTIILLSAAIAVICAAVIVIALVLTLTGGGDSPHIKIDNGIKIVRGELDLSLKREKLETLTIDGRGLPVRRKDETLTDFSKSDSNIFGIDENILIGPGCYFTAHMSVANKEPYAFEFWLEIIPENGDNLLVDQLELTVEVDGVRQSRTLNSGSETEVFPKVEIGQTKQFIVTLKYLDVNGNDLTKNTTLAFDMIVHARLTES